MLDTMTGVKVVGGFCGALLVFLLGGWVAEGIYHIGGGHGEDVQAYTIPVEEDDAAQPTEPGEFDEELGSDVTESEGVEIDEETVAEFDGRSVTDADVVAPPDARDAAGAVVTTRLWVVDHQGHQYLRVGADGSG